MTTATITAAPITRRNKKVDLIMLIEEMAKYLVKPLREDLKEKNVPSKDSPIIILTGDVAEARIEIQDDSRLDTEAYFKLFEAGKISRKDMVNSITVNKVEARKILGQNQLDKITVPDGSSVKMTIGRIKGTTFKLEDALEAAREAGDKKAG